MKAENSQQVRLNLAIIKEFDRAPNIIESLNLKVTTGKLACPMRALMKRTPPACYSVLLAL